MIVDTAFAMALPLIIVVGLAVVLLLALADSVARVGSVLEPVVAIVTFALALAWTTRWWLAGLTNPIDFPFLSRLVADPAGHTSSLPLESLHLDTIGLVGLTAILAVGLVATSTAEGPAVARGTFSAILFVALLGVLASMSTDLMSIAALWVATIVTLASVTLSLSRAAPAAGTPPTGFGSLTPAIDARRWLILVLVGAPALWVVASALVSVTGSSSLVGARGAPTSIVIALILIGAVVAGVPPFASRRPADQRRAEIAFVIDGVLPVVGVLLAARAVEMIGAPRSNLPGIVLAVLGLSGVANVALVLTRRGGGIGAGRIEGSLAMLVLITPTPWATVGSIMVVGIGALIRALERVLRPRRVAWLRRPAAPTARPHGTTSVAELLLTRISRRAALVLNGQIPALVLRLAEVIADHARQAEQRYDLAIGLLIALATVFIYYG